MVDSLMLAITGLRVDRVHAVQLEEGLKRIPGVTDAYVDEVAGLAQVEYAPDECRLAPVLAFLLAVNHTAGQPSRRGRSAVAVTVTRNASEST